MLQNNRGLCLLLLCHVWMIGMEASAARWQARVIDAQTKQPLAARIYLQDAGQWYFVKSADPAGDAIVYDKQNGRSVEKHTSVSPHPFYRELSPGKYTLTVEHGKEYLPQTITLDIDAQNVETTIELQRWSNLAEQGWYSGETHLHRELRDLPTVMLAEDLNVAMPLTFWVTKAYTAPASGDRNLAGEIPERLIHVSPIHVIWPRNTEYEIFTVGEHRHTLGALFVLNHRSILQAGVPPWGPVAEQARAEGALLDMDKLDWPFAMTLPSASGATLYELANNHHWRTEFHFKTWNSEAPDYMQPPRGGKQGNERQWTHYTLGMYYTLLNSGFRLQPTAGTASGVHPVPAGFSRVYVHLPEGKPFSYEEFLKGLAAGRSFVTTGPLLVTTIDGQDAGSTFEMSDKAKPLRVTATITSEHPIAFAEILVNGRVIQTIRPSTERTPEQAYRAQFAQDVQVDRSGWIVVRCFEDRPDGRMRFAHTAPWWIHVPGKPLQVSAEEKDYLLRRVDNEIARSSELLAAEAREEYQAARKRFAALDAIPLDRSDARPARDDADLRRWLEVMVRDHHFSKKEILASLDITPESLEQKLKDWQLDGVPSGLGDNNRSEPADVIRMRPYPGGRHPRIGFPEGAIHPQRDTKLSLFTPWDRDAYVVVDLPEAIFTNLGLTYLAHTHVRTIWEDQKIELPPVEWQTHPDGTMTSERTLPNGIAFGGTARSSKREIAMELWLRNGTKDPLRNMRAQVCVMLKGATGFNDQTGTNKRIRNTVLAVHDESGTRWIVTAWEPLQRAWQNPPVPCLHSDPLLPDCDPGQTVHARGLLSFYEGTDIDGEMNRVANQVSEMSKSP